jgi:hypothetical protein
VRPSPRGLPFAFKLFGLPLVFLGGLVAAIWPVSGFTNVFSAAFIVLAWLPLISAIITFAPHDRHYVRRHTVLQ